MLHPQTAMPFTHHAPRLVTLLLQPVKTICDMTKHIQFFLGCLITVIQFRSKVPKVCAGRRLTVVLAGMGVNVHGGIVPQGVVGVKP